MIKTENRRNAINVLHVTQLPALNNFVGRRNRGRKAFGFIRTENNFRVHKVGFLINYNLRAYNE